MSISVQAAATSAGEMVSTQRRSSLDAVLKRIASGLPSPQAAPVDAVTLSTSGTRAYTAADTDPPGAPLDASTVRTKTFLATEAIAQHPENAEVHRPAALQSFLKAGVAG
ncbi:MAG: hypothetical protein R2834_00980 [Rhodothermales bacterium]